VSDFKEVGETIKKSKRVLLTSHENPDGDAIGSMLGLGLGLESLGKEVFLYNKDGVPSHLEFLPGSDRVRSALDSIPGVFDSTLIVDCTDVGRVGEGFQDELGSGRFGTSIIIDHHQTRKPSADLHLLVPDASATGEIVYFLLRCLSVELTKDVATNLFAAILSDTGSFQYSNTTPQALRVAAELVELGASPAEISQAIYENEPLRKIRLLALSIETLEVAEDGRIASLVVAKDMLDRTGASRADTEGFVNIPRSIKGVEVALVFRQEGDALWKVSLRSKGKVNVASLAENFGGGGHERAAGCTLSGELGDVKRRLYSKIKEALCWKA
jgi:phosphoesterase RecJ-like protein